ncbi:DUF1972 domain-containing protein [Olleya sp. Bg11-27]|uniref:DUF1972 domain-containing protein n=1 Tax=Olleya sp. Bg11-27 TaxID=2058135 RepID=UPI000C2FFC29|nr:DUF1972 domain-containing protein [Olleya sp. Bg11-27]AUC74749.1 glycosyltransferase family 1 protein [Olleya sp. Bg11-27]
MKIAIIGTRGVPNHHGGFEQFAEFFSVFLAENKHEVYVYNSHTHPYQESTFKGVKIIHCKDPENVIGTAGQFLYDLNCIKDARKRDFDIILQLGYTSNSIWHRFLPKKPIIITNMDGLEWKRSKYSKTVQTFLKYAEKLAINSSDYLISDSIGIQEYIKNTYNKDSTYIAYGADNFINEDGSVLESYNVTSYKYNMLIARFEPENNLETILDGASLADKKETFLVVGKHDANEFGEYLKKKYIDHKNIRFIGGVYNLEHLNNLRHFSNLYFHGHSVGGTNPSLLEAMASTTLIIANDNVFNKAILNEDAFYFTDKNEVAKYIDTINKEEYQDKITNNFKKIEDTFNWNKINNQYLKLFLKALKEKKLG